VNALKEKDIIISDYTTGDPFVDAGNLALQALTKRFPDKNIFDLIKFVSDIYVDTWKGKINSLYLNSKITNPAFRGEAKKTETMKLFENYLTHENDNISLKHCRICGEKSILFTTGRDSLCLSGSGAFVNFHHSHEKGLQLCAFCITKLFFLPMIVIYLGGNLAIIDFNSDSLKKFWLKETLNKNVDKKGRNISEGILKYKYSNPVNAIFNMASDIITEDPSELKDESLLLYHFTNFGASPLCDIYSIPNPVFKYMNYVINHCSRDWYIFVNRYYLIKKSKWDAENQYWLKSGRTPEKIEKNDYLNNHNIVFERLISNKTILPLLCRFFKELSSNHKQNLNILIADRYVMEVLKMRKEQVNLIKKIANVVYEIANNEGNLKKYLTRFEGASKAYQLRHVLLKVIKQNYIKGNKEPVCRLDEYVDYLFPDGQYWGEVRDMLLIYLYEKMHDEGIKIEADDQESEIAETENITLTSI
jgi:CRISPR-associated protein Cst1